MLVIVSSNVDVGVPSVVRFSVENLKKTLLSIAKKGNYFVALGMDVKGLKILDYEEAHRLAAVMDAGDTLEVYKDRGGDILDSEITVTQVLESPRL